MELYQVMFLTLHIISLIVIIYGVKKTIKEYKKLTLLIVVVYILVLLNNFNLFFYSLRGL